MKTLLVCNIAPWKKFGGAMRIATIGKILADYGPTDLLLLPFLPTPVEPSVFRRVCVVQQCTGGPVMDRVPATRKALADQLPQWLTHTAYDLVWYCREHSWLMTRGMVAAPSIIDVDDLEDVILKQWIQMGKDDQGGPLSGNRREQMEQEIKWWRGVHRLAAEEADVLVFSSEKDRNSRYAKRQAVVPNTYEGTVKPRSPRRDRPMILFQGLLEWWPNEDAAAWLATGIAPLVRSRVPGLRVVLAGAPSNRVRALGSHMIEVTGEVPDMAPYLDAADLVVAPLRVGSGTRIKILEAFAHLVPVVSTPIGAAGLDVEGGVHLELSDNAAGLAGHCIRLLSNRAEAVRLAHEAHELYQRRHRFAHAANAVGQAVQAALSR